jgi:UrcA family protein
MNSAIVKSCALMSVALATLLTAQETSAVTPGESGAVKAVVVRYQDLDLSQPKDAERLYGRITRAARLACDNNPDSDLGRLAIYENCMREAITNAVSRVNSPQLTSVYRAEIRRVSRS